MVSDAKHIDIEPRSPVSRAIWQTEDELDECGRQITHYSVLFTAGLASDPLGWGAPSFDAVNSNTFQDQPTRS